MSTKPWHHHYGDPRYQDPPDIPEDTLNDYLDDMVYKVERCNGHWTCEVMWGHRNVTQTEGTTYALAIDEALRNARLWSMDREYKEIDA